MESDDLAEQCTCVLPPPVFAPSECSAQIPSTIIQTKFNSIYRKSSRRHLLPCGSIAVSISSLYVTVAFLLTYFHRSELLVCNFTSTSIHPVLSRPLTSEVT